MIAYSPYSIFESPAQTLVNPVNCVGVMGAGLAESFRLRFPQMFNEYATHCAAGRLAIGKPWLCKSTKPWVLCFPTKQHWRERSTLDGVGSGLAHFAATYKSRGITEVAFPALGAGLGGLDWRDVKALMERALSVVEIPVTIHLSRMAL